MRTFKILDLFAGAGGLSLGFEQTGKFEITMAIEINKYAAETYRNNHKVEVFNEDIRNIDYQNHTKYPGLKNVDIIIGGPPCQGFSNANRQKSGLFSNNNLLVKEFVRAIKEIKPKAFIMENVKTINSDKHKFFVTNREKEMLSDRKIESKNEELYVGNVEEINELLIDLYMNKKINSFFMESNLSAKFKSLIRYYKKHKTLDKFLKKNQDFFNRCIINWENHFNNFGSEKLASLINDTGFRIKTSIKEDKCDPFIIHLVTSLAEIHSVISIFKEIHEKNIVVSNPFKRDKGIFVNVSTYTVIDYLTKTLESFGYKLESGVLNAANFGVPQERNRFFIMGIQKRTPQLPDPIITRENFFKIEHALKDIENIPVAYDTLLEKVATKKYNNINNPLSIYLNGNCKYLFNHVCTNSSETALKRFKMLKPGQNFHNLDDSLKTTYSDTKRTQNTIYKRLNYEDVSNTVVNVRKSMWIHPTHDRAISIREAARLQSFPDDYIFYGTKDSQYQQVGNAVPPLLGRAVAEKLLGLFNEKPIISLNELFSYKKEAVH